MQLRHHFVDTNGIRMHVVEAGEGPLVLLCHGFPESWYSWRHQLRALGEAGYRAIAPDLRGYGRTDKPEAVDAYTLLHLVGDMVGLLDALGEKSAVIAGHDWGAPVAWHAALIRPDRFRAVIALSVPFRPRASARPTTLMPQTEKAIFYQLYFQQPGAAEAEFERDPRATIAALLCWGSAERREGADIGMVPRAGGLLSARPVPQTLPDWLTSADLDFYAGEFAASGFRGGLNWYRNIDRNWELTAPWAGAKVEVPALYIAGARDLVLGFRGMDKVLAGQKALVPRLVEQVILADCGHWTQQERPAEVNSRMLAFLGSLD